MNSSGKISKDSTASRWDFVGWRSSDIGMSSAENVDVMASICSASVASVFTCACLRSRECQLIYFMPIWVRTEQLLKIPAELRHQSHPRSS